MSDALGFSARRPWHHTASEVPLGQRFLTTRSPKEPSPLDCWLPQCFPQ